MELGSREMGQGNTGPILENSIDSAPLNHKEWVNHILT